MHVPRGALLSTAALALVYASGRGALLARAWRIPTLFDAVLLVAARACRMRASHPARGG